MARFWGKGRWFLQGHLLRVFKWTSKFDYQKESSIVPVWVRFPDLPISLFEKKLLFSVANLVGKPLKMDELTSKSERITLARVCVEVDLLKPRHDEIYIGLGDKIILQKVVYESIPKYCTDCCHVGHGVDDCYVNGRVPPPPPKNKKQIDLRVVINEKRIKEKISLEHANDQQAGSSGDKSDGTRLVWKEVTSKKCKEKVGDGSMVSPPRSPPGSPFPNGADQVYFGPRSPMRGQRSKPSNRLDPFLAYLYEEDLVPHVLESSVKASGPVNFQLGDSSESIDPLVDNLANDPVLARDLVVNGHPIRSGKFDGVWPGSWVNGVFIQDGLHEDNNDLALVRSDHSFQELEQRGESFTNEGDTRPSDGCTDALVEEMAAHGDLRGLADGYSVGKETELAITITENISADMLNIYADKTVKRGRAFQYFSMLNGIIWDVRGIGNTAAQRCIKFLKVSVSVVVDHEQFIHVKLSFGLFPIDIYVSVVYAKCNRTERRDLWDGLLDCIPRDGCLWVVGGDFFYIITDPVEHSRGVVNCPGAMADFSDFIISAGLSDADFVGAKFTWTNNSIWKRLDRVLLSSNWAEFFNSFKLEHLHRGSSDHCPLQISAPFFPRKSGSFRFQDMWFSHQGFMQTVRLNWNNPCPYIDLSKLVFKLKRLKIHLKWWNKDVFGNVHDNVKVLDLKASQAQVDFDDNPSEEN
ncbi:uncharacterized protein [Henckelia pumila]|uniref:uncharacterized protein n=1 Tax=Henckelia pumila TaxID=405737 RepID=UPI003C6E0B59